MKTDNKPVHLMTSTELCDELAYWKTEARFMVSQGRGSELMPEGTKMRIRDLTLEARKRPDIDEVKNV